MLLSTMRCINVISVFFVAPSIYLSLFFFPRNFWDFVGFLAYLPSIYDVPAIWYMVGRRNIKMHDFYLPIKPVLPHHTHHKQPPSCGVRSSYGRQAGFLNSQKKCTLSTLYQI